MALDFAPSVSAERTDVHPSQDEATLVDLLAARARRIPNQAALVFLDTDANPTEQVTYAELDARARSIAACIETLAAPGERVLILCPASIAFVAAFFGCLYAGVIAVPAYPATTRRDLPRLLSIIDDTAAALLLTSRELSPWMDALASIPALVVDDCDAGKIDQWKPNQWKPRIATEDTIAFLQYTSGSTANPKGVVITHRNAMANQRAVAGAFGHERGKTIMASWLPLYHDMGLGSVIQSLYLSGTVYLLSPLQFLQRPIAWLRAISRYGVTTSGGPSFAYDYCVKRIPADQRSELDLSTWDVAFNGAEPVRAAVMDRFADAFASRAFRREAFYPCYGLAEAVVFVAGGRKLTHLSVRQFERRESKAARIRSASQGERDRALVGCGTAWAEHEVKIVDPALLAPCAEGAVGEIWVRGPSVAVGYWNQPAETERMFGARLPGGSETFLRTGDLGFIADNQLYITGRLKDVIVVRGRKHHAEDIECTAASCMPALRQTAAVAFGVEHAGEERLIVVQELRAPDSAEFDAKAAAENIREAVTHQHGVRVDSVVFAKSGTIPRTSSGKVRRSECRANYLAGALLALAEAS